MYISTCEVPKISLKNYVNNIPFITPERGVDRRRYVVFSESVGVTRVGDAKPIESEGL